MTSCYKTSALNTSVISYFEKDKAKYAIHIRIRMGLILLAACLIVSPVFSQLTTDKIVGQKNEKLVDSLKTADYPYLLPIWGKKVVQKGYKIPKSAGLSTQYLWQQSDIIIDNLQVGFNHGEMYPLNELIRFNSAVAQTNGYNLRPDFWLFPFLNIYLILAQSKSSTTIDAGVWLPDATDWKQVANINTKAEFDATTFGFGITPTFGIGGYFMVLDVNFSWSDISALEKPAYVFVFGPRLGKNFTLNPAKPDQTLAFWVGGFRLKMNTGTSGSLTATELFPINEWQQKVTDGYQKAAEHQMKIDNWWSGLTPVEQKNPVNVAKHEAANRVLSTYGKVLDKASQVISGAGNSSIQYSLDKKPKDKWNFIIGSQFQLNRDWMLRVEYGFLSSRQQLIAGIQYRFNL